MTLTETGERLLGYCQQKEKLEIDVLSDIHNEGTSTPVRLKVSGSTYFVYSRILPHLQTLQENYRSLYFSLSIDDNKDKVKLLKRGDVDFILLPLEEVPLEFDSKILKPSNYVLVGGEKFRKKRENLPIIDFSGEDKFTTNFFNQFNIPIDSLPRHYINNTLMMPAMIEQNIGVAVLDESHYIEVSKNHRIYNLFPKKKYVIEWALVWLPRTELQGYFRDFINLIN